MVKWTRTNLLKFERVNITTILKAKKQKICPRGETDITTVFGTVVAGSSPAEGTIKIASSKRF